MVADRQYDGRQSLEIASKYMPPITEIPVFLHEFLFDSGGLKLKTKRYEPRKQIGRFLIAAEEVRKAGLGWGTFEKQIGCYGQGYGCMARSDYYYWIVRIAINARAKREGVKFKSKETHVDFKTQETQKIRVWNPKTEKIKREVLREAKKMLKWLWKLTVNVSLTLPTNKA